MAICEGCGSSFENNFRFCPHCGQSSPERNEIKVVVGHVFPEKQDTEQTCPKCHKDDRAFLLGPSLLSQSQKNSDGTIVETQFAKAVWSILGSKPHGVSALLNKAKVSAWENAGARLLKEVYYCPRCGVFFFTQDGKKIYGGLDVVSIFIHQSYYNQFTHTLYFPPDVETELFEVFLVEGYYATEEKLQKLTGLSDWKGGAFEAIQGYLGKLERMKKQRR